MVSNLKKETTNKYFLRTATGGTAPVYGKILRTIQLGDLLFEGSFLVADIIDECIIGVDFLTKYGFKIDLEKRILRWRNTEVVMGASDEKCIRVTVDCDIELPQSSENIIWGKLNCDSLGHQFYLMEPTSTTNVQDALIGKCLVEANKNGLIPVRIMNTAKHTIKIKKGQEIGNCQSINLVKSLDVEQHEKIRPTDKGRLKELTKKLLDELNFVPRKSSKS